MYFDFGDIMKDLTALSSVGIETLRSVGEEDCDYDDHEEHYILRLKWHGGAQSTLSFETLEDARKKYEEIKNFLIPVKESENV